MTQERFRQTEDLFHAALERKPGEEREVFLQNACQGDAQLLDGVHELLASFDQWAETAPPEPPQALPRFGPYQTDAFLGAGGMGSVYRAYRADGQFEQQVAIKVLRGATHGEVFRAQFLSERQILAQLNHPHIARLFDGGITPEGELYIAMECVAGEPIDEYCDRHQLTVDARIRLFLQLIDAVGYAHRNLIVHRDLKPSNILVNAQGEPKLLDFGTSKLMAEDATVTQVRALTPRYSSPEQLRGERVTTASDIFSLGILLYELLTGGRPFGTGDSMAGTLERALKETTPTSPHTALNEKIAAGRSTSLNELQTLLRGDLASVLNKALAHDPTQRYSSAAAFGEDLQRYLEGRPVLARPQTFGYQLRKFLLRHRAAVAAAALAIVTLGGAFGYAIYQQKRALTEANRSHLSGLFLARVLQSANPAYTGRSDLKVSELMARSQSGAETIFANEPGLLSDYFILSGRVVGARQDGTESTRLFQQALTAARKSDDPDRIVSALSTLAETEARSGACPNAVRHIEEATNLLKTNQRRVTIEQQVYLNYTGANLARYCSNQADQARDLIRKGMQLTNELLSSNADVTTPPKILKALVLSRVSDLERCPNGVTARQELLRLSEGDPDLQFIRSEGIFRESMCTAIAGDFVRSEELSRQVFEIRSQILGKESVAALDMKSFMHFFRAQAGEVQQALRDARETVAETEKIHGKNSYIWRVAYGRMAIIQVMGHQLDDAIQTAEKLLEPSEGFSRDSADAMDAVAFIARVEKGERQKAKPHEEGARRYINALPKGMPIRNQLEAAVAKIGQ